MRTAQPYDPWAGKHILQASWFNAWKQGETAGYNMVEDGSVQYEEPSFNLLTLCDARLLTPRPKPP